MFEKGVLKLPKILIVDDEPDVVELLQDYFELNGYQTFSASNGKQALTQIAKQPDIIILDINMPKMNGIELCQQIRNFVSCPILFLTARTEDSDKIKGFAVGGDDYIVKPFSIEELGARVAAHIRRELRSQNKSHQRFGEGLVIDYSAKEMYANGYLIPFSKTEFDIVELLSSNAGQVFDKERIYDRIWGFDSEGNAMTVVEHIRKIRGKLLEAGCKPYIETVWGRGYKWKK